MLSFTTDLLQNGNNVGIVIPDAVISDAVIAQLGEKRVHVVVTRNGEYSYRNSTAVMGGLNLIGLSAEHRVASGLSGGDIVEVTIKRDDSPREAVRTSAAPPSSVTVAKPAAETMRSGQPRIPSAPAARNSGQSGRTGSSSPPDSRPRLAR